MKGDVHVMVTSLTPKKERFAQARASGKSQSDAYRASADTKTTRQATVWDTASKIAAMPGVRQRVAEILEDGLKALEVTPELVTEMLLNEANTAESDGARVSALKTLAQSLSMLVQVREDRERGLCDEDLADLVAPDDPELRDLILRRLKGENINLEAAQEVKERT